MLIRHHIHYMIFPDRSATKRRFEFDPPIEIESPVSITGPWFLCPPDNSPHVLQFIDGRSSAPKTMRAPRLLRDTALHFDDLASCVSVACPTGWLLTHIDPGSIHRAEVDIALIKERDAAGRVVDQLTYLFYNPQPLSPVPFNVDALLARDEHNYVKRMLDNRDRVYHKLLLRKCLAPGYQVWPDVMDFEAASVYCDRAKSTIATWVREGRVKASPDTKPLILKKNLDAYLESR